MTMHDTPTFTAPSAGIHLSWAYLWTLVSRRLWLFFVCFLPVLILTIIYLLHAPRVYESTAVVEVKTREQRAFKPTDDQAQSDDLKGDDVIKTIEQNLQNYDLFVNVVKDPAIANDPDFLVGYKGKEIPPPASEVAEWLRSNTSVSLRHGTRLIDVTVGHQVPRMAQKLAQAVIDSFVAMNGQSQNSSQQVALKFLVEQSSEVKKSLQKSEDALQIYKDSLLLKDRIDDQQRVLDALRQRYREKHPQLIQARMLLADLRQTFDQDFKNIIANSPAEAAYWASNSNGLSSATPDDRISTELKLVEARSDVLQKEVDTESALFDNVLKQMRETDVSRDSAATDIRMEGTPPLPTKPSKPRKTIILLLGLLGGTVLGTACAALAHVMDGSIQTPAEAEALMGLPVLGMIPQLVSKKVRPRSSLLSYILPQEPIPVQPEEDLVVLDDPSGAAAEGFRSLRAVINLLGKAAEHRTVLFTSALPGEGKTFVSCNYSLALAQVGLKTLLVDTDLRRPSVHRHFHLENDLGFVEMVTQDMDLKSAVHRDVVKNLDVMCAGGRCPNPAELLAGSGFKDVLTKALAQYDRVVFDCSPVNLVSDSLLIASDVDTVCLIINTTHSQRQAPQHAVNLLRRAHKEPSGIILNAVSLQNDRLYFGYKSSDAVAYRKSYS